MIGIISGERADTGNAVLGFAANGTTGRIPFTLCVQRKAAQRRGGCLSRGCRVAKFRENGD